MMPTSARHIPALDGIRALAILLVIPHNADMLGSPLPLYDYPPAMVIHSGWIGVQLFFVLSGFLITGNLLDARGADNYFSSFFGRRALRILPLYFTVLCVTFVVAPLLVQLPQQLQATESRQIWLWTFLANWTQPYIGAVYGFGHFWSLAVEEQFYLLWPLVVLWCAPRALAWVCVGVAALALTVRILLVEAHFPHDALYMFTICRMDALALGAAAAALVRIPEACQHIGNAVPKLAAAAAVMLLAAAAGTRAFAMYDISTQTVGYTLLSLSFALIVLLVTLPLTGVLLAVKDALSWSPLRLVGRYSYGMYVLHLPLHVFLGVPLMHRITGQPSPAQALVYSACLTLATFLIAALSYEVFESRFLKLKRRFVPTVLDSGAPSAG